MKLRKVLNEAIQKAKAYSIPLIVYSDNETNELEYCSLDVYNPKYYNALFVVLSDGTHEKVGTANVHHG